MNYRYHPKEYDKTFAVPEYGIECFYSENLLQAIFFAGKANNKIWHYRFSNLANMMTRINETSDNIIRNVDSKKAKKAEQTAKNKIAFLCIMLRAIKFVCLPPQKIEIPIRSANLRSQTFHGNRYR